MASQSDKFKQELFELFRKYDVSMEVQEEDHGYQGTSASGVNFFSYTKYDEDGNVVQEGVDVTFGTNEDGRE